jgi:hypothetical protein
VVFRRAAREIAALVLTASGTLVVSVSAVSTAPFTDVATAARDPWFRPFSSTSIWNTPIGSGAQYADAGMPAPAKAELDPVILRRLSPTDPGRQLLWPGSWSDRCSGWKPTGAAFGIPDSWIVPDAHQRADGTWSTPNNTAALLAPDGRTVLNTNALARCTPGGPVFGYQTGNPAIDRTDLYGDGRLGSHGASKLSGLGGAIRPGELSGGAPLQHALDLLVWSTHLHWGGDGYRWPAAAADGYAAERYGGSNPQLKMGSLLAIPPSVTPEQLGVTTAVGLTLFAAMQDYGGYVTDDSAMDGAYLAVDEAAVGTFSWGSGEQADFERIIDAAHVVANNAPTTIGGGGTPRRPLLAELVPPLLPTVPEGVMAPVRIADTRNGATSVDGMHVAGGDVPAGGTMAIQVAGRAGVPPSAAIALLNVTVTEAVAPGFLTVYPCGHAVPNTSTVNYEAGQSVANAAIVELDGAGRACVRASAATDVVVDLSGWFPRDAAVRSTTPTRLLDTRTPGVGRRQPGSVTTIPVTGRAGVPGTGDVGLVALDVTATQPVDGGFATVFPCGSAPPLASNVNFEAGGTVANAVLVQPGASGDVCVYVEPAMHVIVDLVGWTPKGASWRPVPPARLADTRLGFSTADGHQAGTGALPPGGVLAVDVVGRGGVPSGGIEAVILNVTTTASGRDGFLTVYPCGGAVPATSTVNHRGGRSTAGVAVVRLGADRRVCVFSDAPGDLVVDVTGYLTG